MKGLLVDRSTIGVIVAARNHAQVTDERVLCSPDAVVRFNRRAKQGRAALFSGTRPDSPLAAEPRKAQRLFRL